MAEMSIRQKREWNKRLTEKMDAIETATEALYEEIKAANRAGMTPYGISQPLGSTALTITKIIAGERPNRLGT